MTANLPLTALRNCLPLLAFYLAMLLASPALAQSLSINDVTLAEGNAGTTTASFTVSLSVPAGPGGVTFDIATADNTATVADNDYVLQSLTGQTIPQGSSSYTFDVTINGDTNVEANETFFVNVTNVTGATVSDGQGQGTITNDDSPSADLSVTKTDGAATAVPGGSLTYTMVVANAGPDAAVGTTVTDTLPAALTGASWTCAGAGGGTCTASGSGNIGDTVNLPVGGSVTYTLTASIAPGATGTLTNTVTVATAGGTTDPNPANNSATDTDTLAPAADLAITKTDGTVTASPGGSLTYTIAVSNAGPSAATATVSDTLPAALTGASWTCAGTGGGTCTASGSGNIGDTVSLPAGGTVTYTLIATVAAAATGSLTNTSTVTAAGGVTDPNPANNSASDTNTVATVPAATAIPTLSEAGLVLVSVLLAVAGVARRGRR